MSLPYTWEHPVGDLEPGLSLQLRQGALAGDVGARREVDGTWTKPIDLTTAVSVTVHVEPADGNQLAPKLARAATMVDATIGTVLLTWQAGDPAATAGIYRVWTVILWPGVRPQTAPGRAEDYFNLRVFAQRS